jgi:hypothetical protein
VDPVVFFKLQLVMFFAYIYASSSVQGTKHPTVRFNIFVSQIGTRRVELATT